MSAESNYFQSQMDLWDPENAISGTRIKRWRFSGIMVLGLVLVLSIGISVTVALLYGQSSHTSLALSDETFANSTFERSMNTLKVSLNLVQRSRNLRNHF
jgi:uncharacterized BrkB/YihY/UPF0761 family membrane protein